MPPLLVALRIPESGGEPLETLVKTVTRSGAGGLDELRKLVIALELDLRCERGGDLWGHTQARCLRLCRPSLSVISAADMAFYDGC